MYCSDKVVIGLSVSLTGHYKLQGTSSYKGILAWVDRVNSNGGLSDSSNSCRPVELVVYDDESSATGVENNIATLIDDDQVDIILGPYSTNLINGTKVLVNGNQKWTNMLYKISLEKCLLFQCMFLLFLQVI